jgi:hypothetical protein
MPNDTTTWIDWLEPWRGGVVVAGHFTSAGRVAAQNIAWFDGTAWHNIGDCGGEVFTATAHNDELYIGGSFDSIGGVAAHNVAHWTGTKWEALGDGLDAAPVASAATDSFVAFGGPFEFAGSRPSHHFAVWYPPAKVVSAVVPPYAIPSSLGLRLTLSPLPCSDHATLLTVGARGSEVWIEILDFLGRCAFITTAHPNRTGECAVPLSLSQLPPGLYSCRVRAGSDVTATILTIVR